MRHQITYLDRLIKAEDARDGVLGLAMQHAYRKHRTHLRREIKHTNRRAKRSQKVA